MFSKVEYVTNDTQENDTIDKACLDTYKLAFEHAVENPDTSPKGPFIKINITKEVSHKGDLSEWNHSIAQIYNRLYAKIPLQMTDYVMSARASSSGWTHSFSHLLQKSAIDTMRTLLEEMTLELPSSLSL